jgi:hypothetical protein
VTPDILVKNLDIKDTIQWFKRQFKSEDALKWLDQKSSTLTDSMIGNALDAQFPLHSTNAKDLKTSQDRKVFELAMCMKIFELQAQVSLISFSFLFFVMPTCFSDTLFNERFTICCQTLGRTHRGIETSQLGT